MRVSLSECENKNVCMYPFEYKHIFPAHNIVAHFIPQQYTTHFTLKTTEQSV